MIELIEVDAKPIEHLLIFERKAHTPPYDTAPKESELGQAHVPAAILLFLLPILVLVWLGFTLSHWVLGFGVLAVVLALSTAAASAHLKKLEGEALVDTADREPLSASVRDIGISLLGTMAGISLLLLLVLILNALENS